jgi:hypothetical protein
MQYTVENATARHIPPLNAPTNGKLSVMTQQQIVLVTALEFPLHAKPSLSEKRNEYRFRLLQVYSRADR